METQSPGRSNKSSATMRFGGVDVSAAVSLENPKNTELALDKTRDEITS